MKSILLIVLIISFFSTLSADPFYSETMQEYAPVQTTGKQFPDSDVIPHLIDPADATYTVPFNGIPGKKAQHEGMDYVHNNRSVAHVPIKAAAAGTVVYIRTGCPQSSMFNRNTSLREAGAGWGVHIVIHHGHNIYTRYAHLAPNSVLVNTGNTVEQGDEIAEMGNTGRSEVRHLHFEFGYKKKPFVTDKPAQSFDLVFNPESFIVTYEKNIENKENAVNDAIIHSLQIFDSGKYNISHNNDLAGSTEIVEAIKILNDIVYNSSFNNDSKSRYFLAKLYLLQGNMDAGKRWLKHAIELTENNEYSWNGTWGKHAADLMNSIADMNSANKSGYSISEKGKKQLRNIVTYAKNHHKGASNGYCFNSVWGYMTSSGYGKLDDWWDLPNMKSGEARHLAEYLNASASHLKEAGLQRLDTMLSPHITNPHDARIPDGAIIVVAAGSTGTYHATAGDVTVKAGKKFINDGPNMYYGTKANWTGKILGVYVPE